MSYRKDYGRCHISFSTETVKSKEKKSCIWTDQNLKFKKQTSTATLQYIWRLMAIWIRTAIHYWAQFSTFSMGGLKKAGGRIMNAFPCASGSHLTDFCALKKGKFRFNKPASFSCVILLNGFDSLVFFQAVFPDVVNYTFYAPVVLMVWNFEVFRKCVWE